MTLKICVYAISKNEEKFVQRFCEAAKDADRIYIVDTGSTDNTFDEIEAVNNSSNNHIRGYVQYNKISVKPWRFDVARNTALSLISDDIDICVSLDLDEVLQPGWREEIERVWVAGTTRLKYLFDWGWGKAFYYDKIHARHGYRWTNPVHEFPTPYGIEERYAWTDKLLVVHKPSAKDPTKIYANVGAVMPLAKGTAKLVCSLFLQNSAKVRTQKKPLLEWLIASLSRLDIAQFYLSRLYKERRKDE